MIDIFKLKNYNDRERCPICNETAIDGNGFLKGAKECENNCCAPFRVVFNYGSKAWGSSENKLVFIQVFKTEGCQAVFDILKPEIRVYNPFALALKVKVSSFKIPEIKSELWNKVETFLTFQ